MKGSACVFLLAISLCALSAAAQTLAQHSALPMHLLTQRATEIAMGDLPFDKGDSVHIVSGVHGDRSCSGAPIQQKAIGLLLLFSVCS